MGYSVRQRDEALDWLVRSNDPDFESWDEFTAWLERDPGNAAAYHDLADSEIRIRPYVERAEPARRERPADPKPRTSRLALAAGVAVLAAAGLSFVAPGLLTVDHSTSPGEVRIVSLGGKDRLVMNGGTRVELAGFDRRTVHLESGQILLDLRDPGQSKVEVVSGELRLVDIGTVFEVARDGEASSVLVGEGAVMADPGGARVAIRAGERLDARDGDSVLRKAQSDSAAVGAFERGQLVYSNEPLRRVAADLRRSTGLDISAADAISTRRFTGTLSVSEVKRDPASLGPLLDVSVSRSGTGWTLGGRV